MADPLNVILLIKFKQDLIDKSLFRFLEPDSWVKKGKWTVQNVYKLSFKMEKHHKRNIPSAWM